MSTNLYLLIFFSFISIWFWLFSREVKLLRKELQEAISVHKTLCLDDELIFWNKKGGGPSHWEFPLLSILGWEFDLEGGIDHPRSWVQSAWKSFKNFPGLGLSLSMGNSINHASLHSFIYLPIHSFIRIFLWFIQRVPADRWKGRPSESALGDRKGVAVNSLFVPFTSQTVSFLSPFAAFHRVTQKSFSIFLW